ncbi:MAG: hypothetical protein K6T90_06470 [Leptolyngbyaceae cyanobacterium HOT.MB2.61]|jgi:hypothetical protein|nr:hypothetical protein [Leptolyngbyaceae cyanobacterium HOT.MB2.61]
MIGFLKGLFGAGKSTEQPSQFPTATSQSSQNSQSYFLEADDARTLGHVNYMRTAKVVKRTFPKTVDSKEEMEVTIEISSLLKRNVSLNGTPDGVNGSQPPTLKVDEAAERRRTDTSMDMFRDMARNLKKR